MGCQQLWSWNWESGLSTIMVMEGGEWVAIRGVQTILENPRFMGGGNTFLGDILPGICSSIVWHENAIGGLRNLITHFKVAMKMFYTLEVDHKSFTITEHQTNPPHSIC